MDKSKKSHVNLGFIILSSILLLLVLVLAILLILTLYKETEAVIEQICSSPACIHAASTILNYIDSSVDPCYDFYQFACGGFLKNTNIPDDRGSISSFSSISDAVEEQLKSLIQEELPSTAPKPYKLYKQMYNICMNTTAMEVNGLPTIQSFLKGMGGWPLLEGDNWNAGQFEWQQTIYKFRNLGLHTNYFIGFSVSIDKKNSSRRMIQLGEAALGIRREYLIRGIKERLVNLYYDYMVDEAVLFGADKTTALNEIGEILELEIAIAKLCLSKEELRNTTAMYNPMTIEELHSNYPNMRWLEYINKVLDIPDIEITEDEVVNVSAPKFIASIIALLLRTPKRIQANYIFGKVVFDAIYSLPERFRKRKEEYENTFSGLTKTPPRWKKCVDITSNSAYLAIGASYIRKHFAKRGRKEVEEIANYTKSEFMQMLTESDWIGNETRAKALEKAAAMVISIGYPDELLEDKKLEKFYFNLEFTSDNYFDAIRSLGLFYKDYYYKRLREPVNKTDWVGQSHPTAVNAFYSYYENTIKIPAGILQGAFFDDNRPRYMNYGGIGIIIGHELTHGFDDKGSQYDKNGNVVKWWHEDATAAFIKKAQCIINQYGNYTVPEVNVNLNGISTQGENIADNGGVKAAYLAYQSWVRRNSREPKLPGLNYTPNQLFWISAANVWCTKYRPGVLTAHVTGSYHSPASYRILGSFRNNKYFAKDFRCSLGSKMNPERKCEIW